MQLWRISNFPDLSGLGGVKIAGRWHPKGHHVVYCADHPSTALLETLVHATRHTVPGTFQLHCIEVGDDIDALESSLRQAWRDDLAYTQQKGLAFLKDGKYALMKVPSIVMPKANNYILNPAHAASSRITIAESWRFPFDSRLLR